MCPRMVRLFAYNGLQQRLCLIHFSFAEPSASCSNLSFDVARLKPQRRVQISSSMIGLALRERELCELAQTERDRVNIMVFCRGKIARRQGILGCLKLRLEGLGWIIGCSTGDGN